MGMTGMYAIKIAVWAVHFDGVLELRPLFLNFLVRIAVVPSRNWSPFVQMNIQLKHQCTIRLKSENVFV